LLASACGSGPDCGESTTQVLSLPVEGQPSGAVDAGCEAVCAALSAQVQGCAFQQVPDGGAGVSCTFVLLCG
jgi:hypothetical protein